ncbi:MAG: hypothetical protein ABJN98_06690 [Roseibium sp.]
MKVDPFAPILGDVQSKQTSKNRRCIVPVLETAPEAPSTHPKLGRPSKVWRYNDLRGNLLGFVCRFDEESGAKSFRPLTLFEEPGALRWCWQAWPDNRPLYGLDKLAANPTATVLVTEGEKAADAAQELLPNFVTMTAPGGSNGVGKVDFSP